MANRTGAYTAVVAGGVILYSAIHNKRIIDTLLMRNTPGSAASTGAGSTSGQNTNTQGLVSPFRQGTALGRTDMGVDAGAPALSPGEPIYAIGASTLRRIDPNWYQGQPGMFFEFDNPTKVATGYWGWYLAEQINPQVAVGSHVVPGQQVAFFASTGTGIEIGWAASATQTEAQATTGYTEGQHTSAGQSFHDFLVSVHA